MIDRDGPVPIYKQIAEIIREQIDHGDLEPGDAVPSETELEAEYGTPASRHDASPESFASRGSSTPFKAKEPSSDSRALHGQPNGRRYTSA